MKYFLLAALAVAAVSAQTTIPTRNPPFGPTTPLSNQVYADITGDNRNTVSLGGRTNSVQARINNQAFYQDTTQAPRGAVGDFSVGNQTLLPSARLISNTVSSATGGNPASIRDISDWHTFWGQFTDHDFILTAEDPAAPFPIGVPMNDPVFTVPQLAFNRAAGQIVGPRREQRNLLTSFIDASNTYGETNTRANALRTGSNGLLLSNITNPGQDCPFCDEILMRNQDANGNPIVNMATAGIVPDNQLYIGGDVRVNENIALSTVHLLWVREHNRYAREILSAGICNVASDVDECIYQEARRRVVAENQAITLGEYARLLFGDQLNTFVGPYTGFNATVDPGCSNEFGILFRYGHTELNEQIMRFSGRPGTLVNQQPVNLNQAFFNPAMLQSAAEHEWIWLGNTQQRQLEIDNVVSNAVRNTLFISDITMGNTGGDLVARNVQRGRDQGQGSFTNLQSQIIGAGLVGSGMVTVATDFTFLPTGVVSLFNTAYGTGNVNIADSWPISISETKLGTSGFGITLNIVIGNQYRALRDGDAFWYENTASPNPFSAAEISELQSMRLSDVILWNSNPTYIQAIQCNAMEHSTTQTPGGVCENLNNSGSLIMASFGLVASLLVASF